MIATRQSCLPPAHSSPDRKEADCERRILPIADPSSLADLITCAAKKASRPSHTPAPPLGSLPSPVYVEIGRRLACARDVAALEVALLDPSVGDDLWHGFWQPIRDRAEKTKGQLAALQPKAWLQFGESYKPVDTFGIEEAKILTRELAERAPNAQLHYDVAQRVAASAIASDFKFFSLSTLLALTSRVTRETSRTWWFSQTVKELNQRDSLHMLALLQSQKIERLLLQLNEGPVDAAAWRDRWHLAATQVCCLRWHTLFTMWEARSRFEIVTHQLVQTTRHYTRVMKIIGPDRYNSAWSCPIRRRTRVTTDIERLHRADSSL